MNDNEIVALYLERNESAIAETGKKYGAYLIKVAYNILSDIEDSKEKVNDTYLRAWNIIPPNVPQKLLAFLSKITRELSIDEYRKRSAAKRYSGEYAMAFDEISECVKGESSPENDIEAKNLIEKINHFVSSLSEEQCNIFVCRYFYFDSVEDIASYYGLTVSNVKTILHRVRTKLKAYLKEEGLYE